jgi:hypothetical protein
MSRFAEAIEKSQVDVVPKIQMGSQGDASIIENLLALMMTEKLG